MKTLFSTTEVHPRDRFDHWHAVACNNLVDHDSRPERLPTFHAQMQAGSLADVELVLFENSSMRVWHTAHHAERAKADELFICRHVEGSVAVEQSCRDVLLQPGDMTLIDPRSPYVAGFSTGSKLLILKVPRRALEARMGNAREMTCRLIGGSQPENSLLSSFLAMLPDHVGHLDARVEDMVKDQALDLFAVSLSKTITEQKPRVSCARSLALLNLRVVIEGRLTDPALNATAVAGAAGISVRYANVVLAQEGTSILRLIQSRRLARCRQALEDPSQAHRNVSEIAYGWGFSDMTHFGRRFKAAYGALPSDCRRAARRLVGPGIGRDEDSGRFGIDNRGQNRPGSMAPATATSRSLLGGDLADS
jgi:AraC family transcriptional activator of tynA and feaB